MVQARPLCELYTVGERFRRSVNIASDFGRQDALADYIITPLSRSVASRIAEGLTANSRGRAWSITGPYGAGKSACALFASHLLAYPKHPDLHTLVQEKDPKLLEEILGHVPGLLDGGLVIVPAVGSRQPLSMTLLAGLVDALQQLRDRSGVLHAQIERLVDLQEKAENDGAVAPTEIVSAVEETAKALYIEDPSVLGLLIIYDELGKSLEYAALNPESGDIGILQILAESASRSQSPAVGLVTVLHQAFEHYAATLSPIQQREWAKVQGRFEDIGFLASSGELLTLIDKAIQPLERDRGIHHIVGVEVERAASLELLPRDLNTHDAREVLAGCAPLHPSVSLVLGPLFRSRLAQNERSLFAFLSSGEPFGLQEYLRQETWSANGFRAFYRLDNLYDYVVAALGSGLYIRSGGKRWAEIEEALQRLPREPRALDVRLIKAIGMLGLLGDQRYLRASGDVLTYALADGRITSEEVRASRERLVGWGIAVYRRFKDAYTLWQGSDLDLDELWDEGLAQVDRTQSLAELLREPGQLKPYIAKRHLHETGTFRFFVPWVIDLVELEQIRERDLGGADGAIVFVLPPVGAQFAEVSARIAGFSMTLPPERQRLTFFAVPCHTEGIREAFEESQVWAWVADNTPALEGDAVARRELGARRLAARERLARVLARAFDMSSSYRSCIWIYRGQEKVFGSVRDLSAAVSDACGQAYACAPVVKNELVNRRSLSSAVAAARRNLVERMLEQGDKPHLGLEGYPPELSIYLSVLSASGLHHREVEGYAFGLASATDQEIEGSGQAVTRLDADDDDPGRVKPMWEAIDGFLGTTEEEARPVRALYQLLEAPPFGIKEGLLPIYFVAALLHWRTELALYEEGTFVPQPGMPEMERLLRVPERFSIRRYRLDRTRFRMMYEYSALLGGEVDPGEVSVLTAIRPLIAFVHQLPRHTLLTTSLSKGAIAMREALLTAREPQPLLLERLPEAVGFGQIGVDDAGRVPLYIGALKRCLLELQDAYNGLLGTIASWLKDALLLPNSLADARSEVGRRARVIRDWVADPVLRPFVIRLSDVSLPDREWLESVAAVAVHKPPKAWNDTDLAQYGVSLQDLAGRFRRTEEAALERARQTRSGVVERVLRLGVTDSAGREQRQILRLRPDDEKELAQAVTALEEALQAVPKERRLKLLAVAELARRLMDSEQREEHRD